MFYRKIIEEIKNWEESLKIKKRALVIKGLRQIGKTTIVKSYCEKKYKYVNYINFMDNKSVKKIFNKDLNVDNIIRDLSASFTNFKFVPNETVFIFDELQECANARSAIKPFMIDGRFDIVATGSLLGLRGYNKKTSKGIPTGYEYFLNMFPMDFEEYLYAKGINKDLIEYIKDCFSNKKQVSENVNNEFMNYFKEYLCVGGMPDAVNTFLLTSDLNQVYDVQKNILEQYKDDFGKHLDEDEILTFNKSELTRIMEVYNSIPSQLAKENKKFQYSLINKDAKSREYITPIIWLEEFGLIKRCFNVNPLELPLDGNKKESSFKLYVCDTGLFVAMNEKGITNNIINGDLQIYKGAVFENIIADAFCKMGKNLYYYSKNNSLELDFVISKDNLVVPIEVKGTNGKSKSLKEVITNSKYSSIKYGYKLVDGNIGFNDNIITLPLYMAFLIN